MSVDLARRPWITALLFAVIGLALALGGIWLIALGGSFYYLPAGLGVAITGILLFLRRIEALLLYGLVLAATIVWALSEVGLRGWSLEPRLVAPTVLAFWLLLPWVRRRLGVRRGESATKASPSVRLAPVAVAAPAIVAILVLIVGFARPVGIEGRATAARVAVAADTAVPDTDWVYYGRTPLQDRFSPLAQITPQNVAHLKLAWMARTGDTIRPGEDNGGTDAGHEFNFENTPIKVGDTLYVCTGHSWVEAFDAATGRKKWVFDPHANTDPDVYLACRGVAYYQAPTGRATDCPRRIIAPVLDARLVALNADTGRPCRDFGTDGFVALTRYLGHVPAGFHFVTSPPLVLHDRVITGGWIYWSHPIGTTRDTGLFGTHTNVPLKTGIFNIGGNMVTRGGLIFIGATADDYMRAIDEDTGRVLWRARLPAGGQANPMSYAINGKQYVVIAAGGHSGLGTRSGDYVMAYSL